MAARVRKPAAKPARPPVATGKMTPAQLSAYLQRSEQTLANWRWQGKGPRYTKPGGILYDWADVREWEAGLPSGGAGVDRMDGKPLSASGEAGKATAA